MSSHPLTVSDWFRLKAYIQQDLAGVTEADLASCDGQREKLVTKLQEIYGITADEAEGAVAYYEQRIAMWYRSRLTGSASLKSRH
ncbi:MAG: hypothetical protein H0V62_08955 [Gammaproteobacteria bacterium]|nr:hypothetical protein [Gammaproteobacteria bacterium]